MINFEAHTKHERQEMLDALGINNVEDLYCDVPADVRMSELALDKPMS